MKVPYRQRLWLCILAPVLLAGCGGSDKDDISKERLTSMAGGTLKEAFPVSGIVTIDGAPASDVYLYAHLDSDAKPTAQTNTDKDGKFCFSTNLLCDGLPAGEYSLTFRLMPDIPKNKDIGKDLFNGKYKNPKKSENKLTVVAGTPQTEIKIDLKK